MTVYLDTSENFHPYECDGPGRCIHCDRVHLETDARMIHDPDTCALCADDYRVIKTTIRSHTPMSDVDIRDIRDIRQESRIDIIDALRQIVTALDLPYSEIKEITIRRSPPPAEVTVTVYHRNANGVRYIDPDSRRPAVTIRKFSVWT